MNPVTALTDALSGLGDNLQAAIVPALAITVGLFVLYFGWNVVMTLINRARGK